MSLCKVVAIFDEYRLKNVVHELIEHGVRGFTLHPVQGRRRYGNNFNENHLNKHIQMENYTSDMHSKSLCRLIADAASTGAESEGLVSVVPLSNVVWIHDKKKAQVNNFTI